MSARLLVAAVAAILLQAATGAALASDIPRDFAELRQKDERVQRLGFRLATANAPYCRSVAPSLGIMLHDVAAYGDSEALAASLGLVGQIAVQTVVAGGPADGTLEIDDTVVSIGGTEMATLASDPEAKWQRLVTVNDLLDAELAEKGVARLGLADGRMVELSGQRACRTRYEVGPIGKRAAADGARVVIGEKFPGFAYGDPELAAVMAHELAHNVLEHRKLLDARGRGRKLVRATEREADRLAPWLLANAGFDPAASLRFMQEWGPDHSGGWFRKRTHDGWDERAEMIAVEVERVRVALDPDGKADWAKRFVREPETARE